MNRMTKTLKSVQQELKGVKGKSGVEESLHFISSIEKARFFQGELYSSHGNPLYSAVLEEDPSPGDEQNQHSAPVKTGQQRAGKTAVGVLKTPETGITQSRSKSKTAFRALEKITASKENQEPSQPRNQGAISRVRKIKDRSLPTISESRQDTGKRRISLIATAQKSQRVTKSSLTSEGNQTQQRSSSYSEEITDEDESFHPDKEKSKRVKRPQSSSSRPQSGHKQKRKSSSKSSGRADPSKRSRDLRSPLDLYVVLDTFQEFVSQYKQTVNSDSVKRTINEFSNLFEEQLSEIITQSRELMHLKRNNTKLNSTINLKRTRLLEANSEFIKTKTKLRALKKDHDESEQILRALREGTSFLASLQELSRKYLHHCMTHPDEVETYGPSSMPAMLLEARCIMGTEQQLKSINDQLQQVLDDTKH